MWRFLRVTLALAAVTSICAAGPSTPPYNPEADHDAIIIGGGPSGLAALSSLARVRRNVLLIDSGEYRNGPTRHQHDILGVDGVDPAWFRYSARQQISHYETIRMFNGTVTNIESLNNNTMFRVAYQLVPGGKTLVRTSLKIVLATGMRDLLPATPGLREAWGKGIYWCPWCDGHEHADQRLGIMTSLKYVPDNAQEMWTLNQDIVAFTNGTDTPTMRATIDQSSPSGTEYLKLRNIPVENRIIRSIERTRNGGSNHNDPSLPTAPEYDQFRIHFDDGSFIDRDAIYGQFPKEQASTLGQRLGVHLVNGQLMSDIAKGSMTNIPGVYAVGDANSDGSDAVYHALWSGKRAAINIHVTIEKEAAQRQLR
ncbi:hypothetical protein HIM_05204 [Hirsutella minnesotensis 3608]|uniref:FAD/NAD(P)-binding domain-containing protein n=1 Tax=Hirsutella minnesotensis 3608 TaxID=1043627 RepID=A0A0F7ZUQ6_9HYPO|nr:hypothetical protein HIM_05204 [Hirsutella minnesotensis 3608]